MSKKVEINLNKKLNCSKSSKIHFLGIGGIGVSGVAKCFLGLGYKVSGSDMKTNKNTDLLKKLGAEIYTGHNEQNLQGVDFIVASSAIKEDNPEIIKAKELGIEIFHRSHALEFILRQSKCSIGFSGTHGKTTSTGMASLIFELAKKDPTSIIGGILPQFKTNAKLGKNDFSIAELDESDGTIQLYQPDITVVTNLEVDHIDHYCDGMSQILDTFKTFIKNLPPQAKLIFNADDDGVMELYKNIKFENIIFYSMKNNESNYSSKNVELKGLKSCYELQKNNETLGKISLNVPGAHNVSNSLGVIAAAIEAGLSFEEVQKDISEFIGTGRRFELLGEYNGAQIYDDYAHHPTEIVATLASAKSLGKRVVAIFQPHRYSRLQGLWDDFATSFEDADKVIITDVFAAGEKHSEKYNSETFAKEINATYIGGQLDSIQNSISKHISKDDIVLTIGAGDITQLGRKICSQ